MRLSPCDFDKFQHAALELHDYGDAEIFRQVFPKVFTRLFTVDYFLYNSFTIDLHSKRSVLLDFIESSPRMNGAVTEALTRHVLTHPFTGYFLKSGDRTALKTSDFFTLRQFRETEFHREMQHILGVDFTMSIGLDCPRGTASALNVTTSKAGLQ